MQTHKASGIVLGSLAALGCEVLYGLSYIFTKQATNAASPIALLGWRFLIAFVVMSALILLHVVKVDFKGKKVRPLLLAAGALVFVLMALGEALNHGTLPALLRLPTQNLSFTVAVLYQGIGSSVLALFLSNFAIAKIGVNKTASFIGVSTVVSIIAGVLWLGEAFSGPQLLGALIIIIGVYTANGTFLPWQKILKQSLTPTHGRQAFLRLSAKLHGFSRRIV